MNRWVKRIAIAVGAFVFVGSAVTGGYVYAQTSAFDVSMNKVYDFPLPQVTRSADPAVIERGKHLAQSMAGCATRDCHGGDLSGGKAMELGPLGHLAGPNITSAGLGAAYTDGELARLIRHGIKKDGRSLRFMPAQDFSWLPDSDVTAIISYVRSVPAVDKPNGEIRIGTLAKVLDRRGMIPLDIARRIDHASKDAPPAPEATAAYGRYIARLCNSCHGDHLSGGKIPGAPPDMAIPANITPHETGIKNYTFEDFDRLLMTGMKKNGQKVDPMMPVEAMAKMNETEKRALFAYLMSVPPMPFGNR